MSINLLLLKINFFRKNYLKLLFINLQVNKYLKKLIFYS